MERTKLVILSKETLELTKSKFSKFPHLRFDKNTSGLLLLNDRGIIIGLVQFDFKRKYLTALEIEPIFRRKGYAKYLLDVCTNFFGINKLSVNKNNESAIILYISYGFREVDNDKHMIYMEYPNSKLASTIIIGEMHNKEEIGYISDFVKKISPDIYMHELVYEDICLSKTDIRKSMKINKLCDVNNRHIYELAYEMNSKLIGIDLEYVDANMSYYERELFREAHMKKTIEMFRGFKVAQVGDDHLRKGKIKGMGESCLNDIKNSIIIRSSYGNLY